MNYFTSQNINDYGRDTENHYGSGDYSLELIDANCKQPRSVTSYIQGGPGEFRFNYIANGFFNDYELIISIEGEENIIIDPSYKWLHSNVYHIDGSDKPRKMIWVYKSTKTCSNAGDPEFLKSSIWIDNIQLGGFLKFVQECEKCPAYISGSSEEEIYNELNKPCLEIKVARGTNLSNIIRIMGQLQDKQTIGKKILLLESGRYDGSITINSADVTIRGTSKSKLIGECNNANIKINNTQGVDIENLVLVNGRYGIFVDNSTMININSNIIRSINETGICVFTGSDIILKDNEIESSEIGSDGIRLNNSIRNILESNTINIENYAYLLENISKNNDICPVDIDNYLTIKDNSFVFWRANGEYYKKTKEGNGEPFDPSEYTANNWRRACD